MGLREQLAEDLKAAMRAKDANRINAIRTLKAALANFELARTDPANKDASKPITEADLLGVVEKQVKQRRESIELFKQGNRLDLVEKETAELVALEAYMPQQLSRDEIKAEVEGIIAALGTKEFPKVMRQAATQLKGRADGRIVNAVVKELTG
jgi:hypothetical protein